MLHQNTNVASITNRRAAVVELGDLIKPPIAARILRESRIFRVIGALAPHEGCGTAAPAGGTRGWPLAGPRGRAQWQGRKARVEAYWDGRLYAL